MYGVSDAFGRRDGELSQRLHMEGNPVEEAHFVRRRQRTYYKTATGYVLPLGAAVVIYQSDTIPLTFLTSVYYTLISGLLLYLGTTLHYHLRQTYYNYEYSREKWETENYPAGEIQEMVDLYVTRHQFDRNDAQTIINTMVKYPTFFLTHMMSIELNMSNSNLQAPLIEALYPATSLLFFGVLFSAPLDSPGLYHYRYVYLVSHQFIWLTVGYRLYFTYRWGNLGLVVVWTVLLLTLGAMLQFGIN